MNTPVRLAALFCSALAASTFAADQSGPAAVVIERAPEAGAATANEALAALRAANQKLSQDLQAALAAQHRAETELATVATAKAQDETALSESAGELATLRAKVARLEAATPTPAQLRTATAAQAAVDQLNTQKRQLESTLSTRAAELQEAQTQLTTEQARSREVQARLTTMTTGIDRLLAENSLLESQVKQARDTEARLREQLATAEQTAAQPAPDLTAKLSETETKLADAARTLANLRAENALLKNAAADQARLTGELEKLRQEKSAAAALPPPAAAPAAPELTAKVAELEDKLSTTLRSYSLLQTENEQLRAAGTERTAAADELASLRREKAELEERLAATPPPPPDLSAKLAETEDKLNTVLRSYSLLQGETDQIKADTSRATEQANAASARAAGEAAAQHAALFDELRQTQARANTLAAENAQLKTRLALVGPPPGSLLAAPIRPASVASTFEPANPVAAPEQPATPRTHVVVAGDSLTKIARTYYGNANRWDEILNANRDVIRNENVLPLGVTLKIP